MPSIGASVGVAFLAVFVGFLLWTPTPVPESHWSDAPHAWPPELAYFDVQAADDLVVKCFSSGPAPTEVRRSR